MRAFVAGATGYVGGEVVRILVERGVETLAHVRPDSSQLASHRKVFAEIGALVDTTAWDADAIDARFMAFEPHLVFACLGTTAARKRRSDNPSEETYEAVDYGLTAMLLHAAKHVEPPPRIVYLSSAGTGPKTGSAYLKARWKVEKELHGLELPFTIARPAIISGTDREETRPAERVGAVVGDALLNVAGALGFGKVRDRWASMTASELASAMVGFALSSEGLNRVLDANELRARSAQEPHDKVCRSDRR